MGEYDEPGIVTWTKRIEAAQELDGPVERLKPVAAALIKDPARRDLLLGRWLGHALHPVMTDLPIGFWTSATVLDLVGGERSRPAATRLLALGLLVAGPTAATGWAEWSHATRPEQRVGVVHAAANISALGCFAASLVSRWSGRHGRGVMMSLAGSAALGVGGYLGSHLTLARKVSSRHPTFDEPEPAVDAGPTTGPATGSPIPATSPEKESS